MNATGQGAYPISSLTWLLVHENQRDAAKGKQLVDFLRWALTDGQRHAATLDYAPLPEEMSKRLLDRIETIKVGAGS